MHQAPDCASITLIIEQQTQTQPASIAVGGARGQLLAEAEGPSRLLDSCFEVFLE